MTAQPIEAAPLPPVPNTVAGIRKLLPADRRVDFDAELAAVDLGDLSAVAKFRDKWWCRAAVATHPGLLEGIDPNEPMYPSPIKR